MCRKDPGPRCSKCASDKRDAAQKSLLKKTVELSEYEQKWADSLAVPEEDKTKKDIVKARKHERLIAEKEDLEEQKSQAEFIYNSTTVGQDELRKQLEAAEAAGDKEKTAELQAALDKAKEHHEWQLETARKLKKTSNVEGEDAAAEEAEKIYNEAEQEEETVTEKIETIHEELAGLEAEEAEYEQQEEDHESGKRVLSDAELKKIRAQHRRRIILIASLVSAVLVYGFIKEASTGRQSQMFGFLKSMATKHGSGKAMEMWTGVFNNQPSYISAKRDLKERKQAAKAQARENKTAAPDTDTKPQNAEEPAATTKPVPTQPQAKPQRTTEEKKIVLEKAKKTVAKAKANTDPIDWDDWFYSDASPAESTANSTPETPTEAAEKAAAENPDTNTSPQNS